MSSWGLDMGGSLGHPAFGWEVHNWGSWGAPYAYHPSNRLSARAILLSTWRLTMFDSRGPDGASCKGTKAKTTLA